MFQLNQTACVPNAWTVEFFIQITLELRLQSIKDTKVIYALSNVRRVTEKNIQAIVQLKANNNNKTSLIPVGAISNAAVGIWQDC